MPIISVIIPVYNTADYLPKCIESLQNQSFHDLEILLIDDGSVDESPLICDQYALRDTRIQVIHKKNQGVSHARNLGIQLAAGTYVTFVDSDDWVSPDYLRLLYEALQNAPEASIAFCEHYLVKNGKMELNDSFSGIRLYHADQVIYQLLEDKKIKNYTCAKLYRKELFQNISFPTDRSMCEDMAILYQLFYASGKIVHISTPAYYYLIRPGSSINSGNSIVNSYQYFQSYFEMTMFILEKGLLPRKTVFYEKKLLGKGIRLLHRCFLSKEFTSTEAIIEDVLLKLHRLDYLKMKDIGLIYYLKRKLLFRDLYVYKRLYLLLKGKK